MRQVAESYLSKLDGMFPEKSGQLLNWYICVEVNGDASCADVCTGIWWRNKVIEMRGCKWCYHLKVFSQESNEADSKKA